MNLNKEIWTEEDGKKFQKYLKSLARLEKITWTRNILNTKMPLLAITSPEVKRIAKEISKGNFISFLDLWLWDYYENTALNGTLISKIKNFNVYKKYLFKYASLADCWASCDVLTFNVNEKNREDFFNLAIFLTQSEKPFARRIGINIFFKFIENDDYLIKIFELLKKFKNEKEYYVNMCIAWFVAECFVKNRNLTLEFLKKNILNDFTVNKAVQKCRDSFRVSSEDKELLLSFKRK